MSVDQHEQMIDRMLNRQIEARDLDELAQLSQTQPEALVRIAAALRGVAQVDSGVEAAQALAETIELPVTDDRESNRYDPTYYCESRLQAKSASSATCVQSVRLFLRISVCRPCAPPASGRPPCA